MWWNPWYVLYSFITAVGREKGSRHHITNNGPSVPHCCSGHLWQVIRVHTSHFSGVTVPGIAICFVFSLPYTFITCCVHTFINLFKVSCCFLGLPGYLECSGMRARMRDQFHILYNFSFTLHLVTGPHDICMQHVVVGSMTCCARAEQPGQPSAFTPALLGCVNHI